MERVLVMVDCNGELEKIDPCQDIDRFSRSNRLTWLAQTVTGDRQRQELPSWFPVADDDTHEWQPIITRLVQGDAPLLDALRVRHQQPLASRSQGILLNTVVRCAM